MRNLTILLLVITVCSCNATPDALLGRDKKADDATAAAVGPQGYACDRIQVSRNLGGGCLVPDVLGLMATAGDATTKLDGTLEFSVHQLEDGTYPEVETLSYEYHPYVLDVPNYVQFSCVAGDVTLDHERPYTCSPEFKGIHSNIQSDEKTAKLSQLYLVNPTCQAYVSYEAQAQVCYPGQGPGDVPIRFPDLGVTP